MAFQSNDHDRVLLFLVLRQAVRRGLPLGNALRSIREHRGIPEGLLDAMADELEAGMPLSEVMESRPNLFPAPLGALVAVGETSARLDETLGRCVQFLKRRARARSDLGAALIYPAICLILLATLVVLNLWLDPLGGLVALAHESSRMSQFHGLIDVLRWVAFTIPLLAVAVWVVKRAKPKWADRVRLDLPVTGRLDRMAAAAGFTRALSAMLEGGAAIERAIGASIPCAGNAWVQAELLSRLRQVKDGESLAAHLSLPGLFPPSLKWRLAVGETHGDFAKALERAACAYEEDLALYSRRVARLIEPAAILCVGAVALVVTFFLFSRMNLANTTGAWF